MSGMRGVTDQIDAPAVACIATKSGASFPLRVKSGTSEDSRRERNVRFGSESGGRPTGS
jgi:hypothetical protein